MFTVFTELKWFFSMHKKRYMIAIFFLVAVGLLELLPPMLIGQAVDRIRQGTLTASSLHDTTWTLIIIAMIFYIMTYIWMYQLNGGAYLLERKYRSRLVGKFLKMTPGFYERYRTGDLMARATNDLEAVGLTAGFGILTLVDSTFFMISIFMMMGFLISWKLTIAAILPLPLMALSIKYFGDLIEKRYSAAQESFGRLNDQVLDSVAGVRMVRAYVQESADIEQFNKVTEDVYQKNIGVARVAAILEPTIKILVAMSYMIGLGYGAYLVFRSELTLGELVSFNVYLGMLIWPMYALNELVNIMQRGRASLYRVQAILAEVPEVLDTGKLKANQSFSSGEILYNQVGFHYPASGRQVLNNITFTLKQGMTLGVVGKTGSGKTTLLKQLLQEYPAGSGEITLAGRDIAELPHELINNWIGYVPQEQYLFSTTIKDNILFGKLDASKLELDNILDTVVLRDDLARLREGMETVVGEKGATLSGGQKQRISLARALIGEPEILILDDAMSAVDARTEAQILENLRQNRKGWTTLMTTHRLFSIQHADLILVMDNGNIIEQGTHEELVRQNGWYKAQFERQQMKNALV